MHANYQTLYIMTMPERWQNESNYTSWLRNSKRCGHVDLSLAGQIDWPKFLFHKAKATHFWTMMTTVNEVNKDKAKVPDEFFFRSVSLVCFTAELDE